MFPVAAIGADGHDRLITELETAVVAGAREFGYPMHFTMPLGHIIGFVQLYAVAALILRCVAGHVGSAHHIGHGGGLVGDLYDPNADADGQYTVLPDESIIADGLPQ